MSLADGEWHCYEAHFRFHTSSSPHNGEEDIWIDGERVLRYTDVNHGTSSGWDKVHFNVNQKYPDNDACLPIDIDDVAISNTGRIGCLGVLPPARLRLAP